MDNDLELLPVVNKIDLPSTDNRVLEEVEEAIGLDSTHHNLISDRCKMERMIQ